MSVVVVSCSRSRPVPVATTAGRADVADPAVDERGDGPAGDVHAVPSGAGDLAAAQRDPELAPGGRHFTVRVVVGGGIGPGVAGDDDSPGLAVPDPAAAQHGPGAVVHGDGGRAGVGHGAQFESGAGGSGDADAVAAGAGHRDPGEGGGGAVVDQDADGVHVADAGVLHHGPAVAAEVEPDVPGVVEFAVPEDRGGGAGDLCAAAGDLTSVDLHRARGDQDGGFRAAAFEDQPLHPSAGAAHGERGPVGAA